MGELVDGGGGLVCWMQLTLSFSRLRELGEERPRHGPILFPSDSACLPGPLSDGDAESIQAFYGFYGNPIYRPYGFGAWGVGSSGFGYNTMVSSPNSLYGGYYYAG